jgi:hypothetical protein
MCRPAAAPVDYFQHSSSGPHLSSVLTNANSPHKLYRNRLGSAFLIRRQMVHERVAEDEELDDGFCLTDINPKQGPYHLINTALNVPGSPFANRRGRNADFFVFSCCFNGSEAPVMCRLCGDGTAERAVDGLNIGTAMAISGAAAAPNMRWHRSGRYRQQSPCSISGSAVGYVIRVTSPAARSRSHDQTHTWGQSAGPPISRTTRTRACGRWA